MGFFNDLKLKNRMAKRIGAFLRGRDRGMTADEAHAYANETYPPTPEDIEYEKRMRAEQARRHRGA